MADLDPALLETGRQIVRDWSESNGKGLALSIIIAKALQSEGDRRAEGMRTDCVNALLTERIKYDEDGEGYNVLGDAIDAIRSLPLEKK
ncbi:MAG TPA: hypothetical protein VGK73_14785 [Polyangiaceae bacterium]